MEIIRLYVDETFGYKKTFTVNVAIWGKPENCTQFEEEVGMIVSANQKVLGKDFRGFHASKLNDKNWSRMGPIYEQVFSTLIGFNPEKLGIHVYFESKKEYELNTGYIKNLLKEHLTNADSEDSIRKYFSSLNREDMIALYQRIDKLMVYWIHKGKYAGEGTEYEFYPDSSGKILDYKEKEFLMSDNLPINMPMEFYNIIKLIANSFANAMNDSILQIPNKNQRMIKYQPLPDEDSYLLQTCDIISNLFYNHLKYETGIKKENERLKSELFKKYFEIFNMERLVRNNFTIEGEEIVCTNSDARINIM